MLKEIGEAQLDYKILLEREKRNYENMEHKMLEKNLRCEQLENTIREKIKEAENMKKERDLIKNKYEDIQIEIMKFVNKNNELIKKNNSLSLENQQFIKNKQSLNLEPNIGNLSIQNMPKSPFKIIERKIEKEEEKNEIVQSTNMGNRIPTPEEDFDFEVKPQSPINPIVSPIQESPGNVIEKYGKKQVSSFKESKIAESDFNLDDQSVPIQKSNNEPVEFDLMQAVAEPKIKDSPVKFSPGRSKQVNKSAIMQDFDLENNDEQKSSQTIYATEKPGDTGSPMQTQMLRIESEIKYRNCIINSQSKWYEDRYLEIGIIRNIDQDLKTASFKIYFGNKTPNLQILMHKFSLAGHDEKCIFL